MADAEPLAAQRLRRLAQGAVGPAEADQEQVALGVADRLCNKMANDPIKISGSKDNISVTLSIGVANSQSPNDSTETLLKQADEALYEAKRSGRNRVIPIPGKDAKNAVQALPG